MHIYTHIHTYVYIYIQLYIIWCIIFIIFIWLHRYVTVCFTLDSFQPGSGQTRSDYHPYYYYYYVYYYYHHIIIIIIIIIISIIITIISSIIIIITTCSFFVRAGQTCLGALSFVVLGLLVVSRRLKHATSHCPWRCI